MGPGSLSQVNQTEAYDQTSGPARPYAQKSFTPHSLKHYILMHITTKFDRQFQALNYLANH